MLIRVSTPRDGGDNFPKGGGQFSRQLICHGFDRFHKNYSLGKSKESYVYMYVYDYINRKTGGKGPYLQTIDKTSKNKQTLFFPFLFFLFFSGEE